MGEATEAAGRATEAAGEATEAAGEATEAAGEATGPDDPDRVLRAFPGDHPLADFHLLRRRGGDAAPAILWRTDLTADPEDAVAEHGPAGKLGPAPSGSD